MASPAIEARLGKQRSGVPDPRPTAGGRYYSSHAADEFMGVHMQRALIIRLSVIQGPLPTRIRTGRGHSNHTLGPRWSDVHDHRLLSAGRWARLTPLAHR